MYHWISVDIQSIDYWFLFLFQRLLKVWWRMRSTVTFSLPYSSVLVSYVFLIICHPLSDCLYVSVVNFFRFFLRLKILLLQENLKAQITYEWKKFGLVEISLKGGRGGNIMKREKYMPLDIPGWYGFLWYKCRTTPRSRGK